MRSLAFGACAALAVTAAFAAPPDGPLWYTISVADGSVIGHAEHDEAPRPDGGRDIIDSQTVDVGAEGSPSPIEPWLTIPSERIQTRRTVLTEDAEGRAVALSTQSAIGSDSARLDARIDTDSATVTRTTAVDARSVTVALPPGVRFDDGEGLLPGWDPAATPRLEFDAFDIDAMAVEHVVIELAPSPDPAGRLAVLRKSFRNGHLTAFARLFLDSVHRIVETDQPMFRSSIAIRLSDRATALKPHPFYHPLPDVMAKSPFRIPSSALQSHIRYSFSFPDGVAFDVPQTGEQRVSAAQGAATVDICGDCGPGLPSDKATLADALKPTVWMQSDSPALHAIADPIAAQPISDTRKMELLLRKAWPLLGRLDFTGHYSALETLSRHAGDCTEAAVLLAALGRAAGIPTRVANGLVYSRESYHGVSNAFLPHSWTLAWADGQWRSFDLALGNFDTTHIALAVGDGDEASLATASQRAGLLHWDGMAEVRAPPAN